ncbi:MAG TPA: D-erythronate dehydrogenase [Casimicrobiaceae bacterium]|nr:D-erythronate dehydrogenase [Casimicrobiaceae bacterium]
MRVVITGGAGFLGSLLARAILERGALTDSRGQTRPIRELVLVDVVAPATAGDPRVRTIVGSLADRAVVDAVISSQTDSVFHLAAVVSGQAEAEFDVGMRVNVDATRNLLERCRACAVPPKFVFASSLAVFGGTLPDPVPDDAPVTPQTSYGTQKAIAELLVSDMSRKGFIDGRSLRLPTIVVRPGKPNKAASSFASGIIREPLAHVAAICPVAPSVSLWLQSPRAVVANFVIGHEVPADAIARSRAINVPGISVAVRDMVKALRTVAGDAVAGLVRWERDPVIDRIVSTWPARFTADAGRALGMRADDDFESIVRAHQSGRAAPTD